MTKKHMWLRLLSLLLICGMILGCFAGCSDDAGEAPEVEKIDRTEPNDSPIMPDGGQITLSV